MKRLDKIIRSVQAFGRGLSGQPSGPGSRPPSVGIGLALGGGFARGIAHVGVLKVLEEENIPVSYIAGTSVGALIGAAYCSGISAAELEQVAARVRFKHIASWTLSRYGFASNQRMIGFLNHLLKVKTFEELRIPLAVTATDFSTGEGVLFPLRPARRSGPRQLRLSRNVSPGKDSRTLPHRRHALAPRPHKAAPPNGSGSSPGRAFERQMGGKGMAHAIYST